MKKKTKKRGTGRSNGISVLNHKVAGIDVGASGHSVCGSGKLSGRFRQSDLERLMADLEALADWLYLGVESVAMESTGVYWVNLYDELEGRGLKICLANARYVRNVPGRKKRCVRLCVDTAIAQLRFIVKLIHCRR